MTPKEFFDEHIKSNEFMSFLKEHKFLYHFKRKELKRMKKCAKTIHFYMKYVIISEIIKQMVEEFIENRHVYWVLKIDLAIEKLIKNEVILTQWKKIVISKL